MGRRHRWEVIAKDGKIGNAGSEDGARSLLHVRRDRREVCSWGEYSTGFRADQGTKESEYQTRRSQLKFNRWRTEKRHIRRPRMVQTTVGRLTSGLRCQELVGRRQMLWKEGKIVKNFGSETKVKGKSSYQGYEWVLERREESEEDSETQQDWRLQVLLEEQRNSEV